jgi:hypothetical protein
MYGTIGYTRENKYANGPPNNEIHTGHLHTNERKQINQKNAAKSLPRTPNNLP